MSIPPPPYQLRSVDLVQIFVTFDPEAVRPLLPPGLRLAEGATGAFYCYSAPEGWGIAPYTACLIFVDIDGFTSSDGTKGRAMLAGFYSGKAGVALRRHLHLPVLEGGARLDTAGGRVIATGFSSEEDVVRLVVEPEKSTQTWINSGVNCYLATAEDGAIEAMPVAYCIPMGPAKPVSVSFLTDDERLTRLTPRTLLRGGYHQNASMTLGSQVPLTVDMAAVSLEEARIGMLNLLAEIGKPLILLDEFGKIAFINKSAERAISDGLRVVSRRLTTVRPDDQKQLDELIVATLAAGPASRNMSPIAIGRRNGLRPLILRVLAIEGPGGRNLPNIAGAVLITDPDLNEGPSAFEALRLLGLTPAEARIASLIGAGVSPREAARRLGNTERTVRFTLGRIFAKLEISRQSELSVMVSRLQDVGPGADLEVSG